MSMPTANYGFILPAVNSPTDADLWGGELNANISEQDALFLTAINFVTSAPTTSFSVTAPTTGSSSTGSAKDAFLCNATSGAITATLPAAAAAGNGFTVAFKKTDSSVNAITLTAVGSDTIDGAPTFALSNQYNWTILICDGSSKWSIFSDSAVGLAPLDSPAFTGIPTAPTAGSGTSTTQLATTQFVNPSSSLMGNGSQQFASGLVMQWGQTIIFSPGTLTVTFPTPFINNCWSVVATSNSPDGTPVSNNFIQSFGTTNFVMNNKQSTSAQFTWIAIGN